MLGLKCGLFINQKVILFLTLRLVNMAEDLLQEGEDAALSANVSNDVVSIHQATQVFVVLIFYKFILV